MGSNTITLTKRQLKKLIQKEVKKELNKPQVVNFSISEAVSRNRERIIEILHSQSPETSRLRLQSYFDDTPSTADNG